MPDDLRSSWCNNNNRNKVGNKCNVLESSPNHPSSPVCGKTVFHKIGAWFERGWGQLEQRSQGFISHEPVTKSIVTRTKIDYMRGRSKGAEPPAAQRAKGQGLCVCVPVCVGACTWESVSVSLSFSHTHTHTHSFSCELLEFSYAVHFTTFKWKVTN